MYDNLVLSPGHGVFLPGAVNSKFNVKEYLIAYKLCIDLVDKLKGKIQINMVYDDVSKNVSANMGYLKKLHKKYDVGNSKTLHIFVHINAGGGTGVEMIYKNAKMKALAVELSSKFSKVMMLRDRGAKYRDDLSMVNNFSHSILTELFFIDSKADLDAFNKNYNKLLDVFVDIILDNVRNLNKKIEVIKPVQKVESVKKVEVESDMCKCNGNLLTNTGRKGIISLSKKAVRDKVFTSPHSDIEKYSDGELISLLGAFMDRVYDDLKGSK